MPVGVTVQAHRRKDSLVLIFSTSFSLRRIVPGFAVKYPWILSSFSSCIRGVSQCLQRLALWHLLDMY